MTNMDIEALRKRLAATKNLSAVSRRCGLSLKTLYRTRDGETTPLAVTANKIIACLDAIEAEQVKPPSA
jgi:DNA-binding phage protein